jgi:membrane-associated phospholipid phosphatase
MIGASRLLLFLLANASLNAGTQETHEIRQGLPEATVAAPIISPMLERPVEGTPHSSGMGTWNVAEANVTVNKVSGSDTSGKRVFEENAPRAAIPAFALLARFAADQRAIWSSPLHLRREDSVWAFPALAATGAFLASDTWFSKQLPSAEIARSRSLSRYGVLSLVGATSGIFLFGDMTHNDHAAETGILAGEAALNAAFVDYALKSMFRRDRPYQGAGEGRFFSGGTSFPSEHAAVSWAIAGVIAHEYPGPLTKLVSYGLASAVSVARVTGKEHFPSDVVVGSALGYFTARQIYRSRRDPEISEAAWGSLTEKNPAPQDKVRSPRNMGSSYIPLESWVYPAIERLAALGYVQTAYLGLRPWSRMGCARLLEEAQDAMRYGSDLPDQEDGEAATIYTALVTEFRDETARLNGSPNVGASLDSIYTRVTGISGTPLRDGYHFGQSLINDFGRPYAAGFNQISGIEGSALAGPFSFSLRGEYQHAPAVAPDPPAVQQAIAVEDGVGIPLADGSPTRNQFRLIEASVGLTLNNIKISFGKQNLWLGPGESGPLLLSDNAPPITMLQIDNVSPVEIPGLSRVLGPARMNSFLGELSGQNWVYNPPPSAGVNPNVVPQYLVGPGFHPQPFLHGNKISFHPTPNLEFGMGVTAIFGGPGLPFTWREFFRSYYSHNANISTNPAKRFSSFDFTYRVPGLRKYLTLYSDSLVGDEVSPIGSTRPMLNPGLYLPQIPKAPKLELRIEGFKAEPRLGTIYIDRRYHSGYANAGNLIGSWIGRQALGGEAWVKYSFTPRASLQIGYRHQEVDRYLAGGGHLNDFSATYDCRFGTHLALSARAQYERWAFVALHPGPQSDFSTSMQLSYYPGLRWRR